VTHCDDKPFIRKVIETQVQANSRTTAAADGLDDVPVWECLFKHEGFNSLAIQELYPH
jgi:hypothetical protein